MPRANLTGRGQVRRIAARPSPSPAVEHPTPHTGFEANSRTRLRSAGRNENTSVPKIETSHGAVWHPHISSRALRCRRAPRRLRYRTRIPCGLRTPTPVAQRSRHGRSARKHADNPDHPNDPRRHGRHNSNRPRLDDDGPPSAARHAGRDRPRPPILRPHLGPRLLDMAQQPLRVDGRPLGSPALLHRQMEHAPLGTRGRCLPLF